MSRLTRIASPPVAFQRSTICGGSAAIRPQLHVEKICNLAGAGGEKSGTAYEGTLASNLGLEGVGGSMTECATLVVLAYKQAAFVEHAVKSAFAQVAPFGLEIILSDDCSPDDTFEKMQNLARKYVGPHRIVLNRQKQNSGMVRHFTDATGMASHDIVVYLAGDDVALPDRAARTVQIMRDRPEVMFVEGAFIKHFGHGEPVLPAAQASGAGLQEFDLADYINNRAPRLSSSTRTFRKSALQPYEDLAPVLRSEDTPTALRLLFRGKGMRLECPILVRRFHDANVTGATGMKHINFDDIGDQYEQDAARAFDLGYIDRDQYAQVMTWSTSRTEARKLHALMDLGRPTANQLFRQIFPSRKIGLRRKLFAFRRWLRMA